MAYVIPLPPVSSLNSARLPKTLTRQTHDQQQQLVVKLRLVAGIYAVLYTYTKKESEATASLKEAKLTHLVSENEQQLSKLRQGMVLQHKAELKAVTGKMVVYQEECRALSLKIEQIESNNAQISMADSGSYQDSAATPPLLQSAADAVKDAMAICASNFFATTRKQLVSISLPFLRLADANFPVKKTGPSLVKAALQAFLCYVLFEGFEGSWNGGLFEKPKQRKQKLFQDFIVSRHMDDEKLLNENGEFNVFFHSKASSVAAHLPNLLFAENDATQGALALVCSEIMNRCGSNAFYMGFLRLSKAVWLLHKLVFAFQPSAEILRICEGSGFDEEFMENVDKLHEEGLEEGESGAGSELGGNMKSVRFMCVPGFTVRHTVIKSWVSCFPQQTSI